jgi:predicted PhzF superfamily epimerase YddE/YHI9
MNAINEPDRTLAPEAVAGGALYRLAAFAEQAGGGNPAGVWIGDSLPDIATMQRIAADVGYSETAFIAPAAGSARTVRYFSPLAEVPFCGHATIAAGVALVAHAEAAARTAGDGGGTQANTANPVANAASDANTFVLDTRSGAVTLAVTSRNGLPYAALTSVAPRQAPASPELVDAALSLIGWRADELDPAIPPVRAYAGAWHLVLAAATRDRLAQLHYDMPALAELMRREDLVTLQLVWRESASTWHARNPFPVGGVYEDPATGAAAAAFGGYLRDAGLVPAPATLRILQGEAMGRPSVLEVEVPASGGIIVRGGAVPIRA